MTDIPTKPPAAPAIAPLGTAQPAVASAAGPVTAPDMPKLPPPPPVIPPPIMVPTRPPPPPPPLRIAADAPGTASAIGTGLRVTFGAARADLNPTTERAIRALAHSVPADARFDLAASAAGKPDDSSAARRLSLSRGLNVRAVLINAGVASGRILLRSLAAPVRSLAAPADDDDAPDRVDLAVQGQPGPPQPVKPQPAKPQPAKP